MRTGEPTNFRKVLDHMTHSRQSYEVFSGFCRLAACALAAGTREAEYLEEAKRWKPEELQQFAAALGTLINEMQEKPYEDLLGHYYMEFALSSKGQQWGGEFHTPKPICDMMARMTMGEIWKEIPEGPIHVCEPACGAGAMVLGVAQETPAEHRRRLRVTCIDIKVTACDMCFINTTLWGIPARIYHGNTISMEMWAAWRNIHWVCPWLPLAMNVRNLPPQVKNIEQGQPPPPEEVKALAKAFRQMELI